MWHSIVAAELVVVQLFSHNLARYVLARFDSGHHIDLQMDHLKTWLSFLRSGLFG